MNPRNGPGPRALVAALANRGTVDDEYDDDGFGSGSSGTFSFSFSSEISVGRFSGLNMLVMSVDYFLLAVSVEYFHLID